MVLYF